MNRAFVHRRRVNFSDTDAAGIAHFSRMLCWVEEAEYALWASLGYAVHPASASGLPAPVGWPRAGVEVRYREPVRLDEEVEVHLAVAELRGKLLVWSFELRIGGGLRAEGRMPVVAVRREDARLVSVPVPEEMAAALQGAGMV